MTGEQARIPIRYEERDQIPADERHNYDLVADPRGGVPTTFAVLLNSPEVGGRIGHLGAYLRFEGVLPGAVRELAILTAAREFDCDYEWAAHEPIAREEGVRDEVIEVVADRGRLDGLQETEALIVQYGRELFRDHRVSDETFEPAREHFGVQGLTELTVTFGYYGMLAFVQNAFELPPSDDGPTLPS